MNSATETASDLVAGDRCLSLGWIRQGDRSFGAVAKSRLQGLNQKATGEESVARKEDDLDELEEAGMRGMVSNAEHMPIRKITIWVSIETAATATFSNLGREWSMT
ncbi:hypothetical protein TIFTF001_032973 [Ficus carica]|uniref:Uncharacterized protein n=1 Tax=Ficus carica TaxID=3494 RepID=A0AA88DZL3_FICCA|nr:hypothetical protein TIFTF001_032973 [Ficus carica]